MNEKINRKISFIRNLKDNKGRATIASVLIVSLLVLAGGLYSRNFAKAAAMTSVKDVVSTSVPDALANHTITFTLPSGQTWAAGETLVITFPAAYTLATDGLANTDPLDYDIRTDTGGTPVDETLVAASGCAASDAIEVTTVTETAITFTACGSFTATPATAIIEVQIGLNATNGGDGNTQIDNPVKSAAVGTADVYQIALSGTIGSTDTGTAMVAIIEGVTVSVTIDESLSFVLAAETAANCPATLPGTDKSDDSGHTDTAITFGSLSSGNAFNHSCHLATVSTNAGTGYTTTVEKTQLLTHTDLTTTIADGTCNGACSASVSAVWTTTTSNGFGYCLQDASGNPSLTSDSSDDAGTGATDWVSGAQCNDATPQFKTFPTTATTEAIMKSYTPVSGDQIRFATVLDYPGSQKAGTYSTTLVFVTTPTF